MSELKSFLSAAWKDGSLVWASGILLVGLAGLLVNHGYAASAYVMATGAVFFGYAAYRTWSASRSVNEQGRQKAEPPAIKIELLEASGQVVSEVKRPAGKTIFLDFSYISLHIALVNQQLQDVVICSYGLQIFVRHRESRATLVPAEAQFCLQRNPAAETMALELETVVIAPLSARLDGLHLRQLERQEGWLNFVCDLRIGDWADRPVTLVLTLTDTQGKIHVAKFDNVVIETGLVGHRPAVPRLQ